MKKLILLFLLFFVSPIYAEKPEKTPKAVIHNVTIIRVIDGDTIAFKATFLPEPLKPELSLRVYGVDTPEKGFRAKCESEAQRGEEATKFTTNLVKKTRQHQIRLMSWDKYGGRVLGDLLLDGQSLRKQLIEKGYAREYFGEAKQSWCN